MRRHNVTVDVHCGPDVCVLHEPLLHPNRRANRHLHLRRRRQAGEEVERTLYWTGPGWEPLLETDLAGNATEEYVFFNGGREWVSSFVRPCRYRQSKRITCGSAVRHNAQPHMQNLATGEDYAK